jgi:peptidoglycan hydrolase-like protein with peptidoglycan-binding domain
MKVRLWMALIVVAVVGGACSSSATESADGGPATTTDTDADTQTDTDTDADTQTDTGAPGAEDGDNARSSTSVGSEVAEADGPDGAASTGSSSDDEPEDRDRAPARGLNGPANLVGPAALALSPVEPGDRGHDVETLQARLAELGFAPGPLDGSYGSRTEAAVEAFQGLVELPPTGVAEAATVSALLAFRYDGPVLRAGDEGSEVEALQRRLRQGPFDPGAVDGTYGAATIQAVWALEKLAGVPVDGDWGPLDERAWELLSKGEVGQPTESHDQRWVEIDLSQQLVKVYDPGSTEPVLVTHASSGSGIPWANETASGSSITPVGEFHIYNRISGWRESSLNIGRLYNPLYFTGGIALHGSLSVPLYPASHGCVRLPMHVAEYLPRELPNGTPVHVMA